MVKIQRAIILLFYVTKTPLNHTVDSCDVVFPNQVREKEAH